MVSRIGSINMSSAGRTLERVEGRATGTFAERILLGAERPLSRIRAPRSMYVLRAAFANGADDETDIYNLKQYYSAQVPIWLDHTDNYGELEAFGYIQRLVPSYLQHNLREFEIIFFEIPAWGRLYTNKVQSFQLHNLDSADDWTVAKGGGSAEGSIATTGMREGKGCYRITCSSATTPVSLTYNFPYAMDLRPYSGFSFWLKLSSITGYSDAQIWVGQDASNYNVGTVSTIPCLTGTWFQMGFQRDNMTVGAGSPNWDSIDYLRLNFVLSGALTGNIDVDDLWVTGTGEDVMLHDLEYINIGSTGYQKRGLSDILSPAYGRYGWTHDRTNKYWQQEVYVINERLKQIPTTIHDCSSITDWSADCTGAKTATLSLESAYVKEGTSSVKASADDTLDSGEEMNVVFNHPSDVDISKADFITFWFISSVVTDMTFHLRITDTDGDYYEYAFTVPTAYEWCRVVLPLRNADITHLTPDLSKVDSFGFYTRCTGDTSPQPTVYIDDICTDFGNWAMLEMQIPDNLNDTNPVEYDYYDTGSSAYADMISAYHDHIGRGLTGSNLSSVDTLSGEALTTIYNGTTNCFAFGYANTSGETYSCMDTTIVYSGSIVPRISRTLGCQKRILFGFKLAPDTESTSATGDYAINKMRVRIKPYYAEETTSILD